MQYRHIDSLRVLGVCAILLGGCSHPVADTRAALVCTALAVDNQVWLAREPATVVMKLTKMQRGWYEWLRGTAVLFWADATGPTMWNRPTAFGDFASSNVRVVGDPHVENLGSFRASDGTMFVDWNDLDANGYAPYWIDARRLALTIVAAATAPNAALDPVLLTDVSHAVAAGYVEQITALANGERPLVLGEGVDPLFDKLLEKAKRDGDALRRLNEVAPVVNGQRRMGFGPLEPAGDDGVVEHELTGMGAPAESAMSAIIASWRATTVPQFSEAATKIKGMRRRLGAGVASYPALRYYVLMEGPSAALDDDLLAEIKESRDGIFVAQPTTFHPLPWQSNGERVATGQREVQGYPNGDPLLGWAQLGPQSYRVVSRTGYQRGLNASDIFDMLEKGAAGRTQLIRVANLMGQALARAHGQALTAAGVRGHVVIAPLLKGQAVGFGDEVAAFVAAYAPRARQDFFDASSNQLTDCVMSAKGPLP